MSSDPPVLPDTGRTGDERTILGEMLDYYRAVLLRKGWGLDADQLARTIPPSDLSLGGLLFHMGIVEDSWFTHRFAGREMPSHWATIPWDDDPDWELHNASTVAPDEHLNRLEEAIARSRSVVAEAESLDQVAAAPARDGRDTNLRWILVHLIEEYARHCGHADLLREVVDGATGD